jgi:hypothetical protein
MRNENATLVVVAVGKTRAHVFPPFFTFCERVRRRAGNGNGKGEEISEVPTALPSSHRLSTAHTTRS